MFGPLFFFTYRVIECEFIVRLTAEPYSDLLTIVFNWIYI